MRKATRICMIGLLVGLACSTALPAHAQYPPVEVPLCAELAGGAADGVVEFLGTVQVGGEAGCAEANGQVAVDGQSHRFNLHPGFQARADGSYLSPVLQLPAHMQPGPHRLISVIQGRGEVVLPILVVDADGGGGGGGLTNAANTDGGGGGGGGTLPKTGGNILMLILWGLALLALGTTLVVAARRGNIKLQPLRLVGARWRGRTTRVPLLPPPDVPFIDTTGFVPMRPPHAPSQATSTEADALRDGETPWEG